MLTNAAAAAAASATRVTQAAQPASPGGLVASLLSARGCLTLARGVWSDALRPGDIAVDATCGNGNDAAELATILARRASEAPASSAVGRLVALDIQPAALDATRARLDDALRDFGAAERPHVELLLHDHASFPPSLAPGSVRLVVYNLGYLPHGDHSRTTTAEGTVRSLQAATELLCVGGMITAVSYPAHPEGVREAAAVHDAFARLDKHRWRVLVCRPSQNEREKFLTVALRRC